MVTQTEIDINSGGFRYSPKPAKLRILHYAIGLVLIGFGFYWMLTHGYWEPAKVVFPVYPMSLILIGGLVIGLDYFYGDLALVLAVFCIFSYDLLVEMGQNELLLLSRLEPFLMIQIFLTAGAWIIASKPRVKISWKFIPFFVVFLLLSETRAYHLIEASYYATMIPSFFWVRNEKIKRL